jgi:5,5'-dehydrodivanillate O-demethylase
MFRLLSQALAIQRVRNFAMFARVNDQGDYRSIKDATDFASAGPRTPGGTFLRQFWQPVHMSTDLPNGRAKPIHIMGEKFTLYRGQGGDAHVVGHRCPHRMTQLSAGWVKGDHIQCMYHGWKFDGAGHCVERPGEEPSGPNAGISIPAYPTREHMGLIYAYFGPGDPPSFPPFPVFEGDGIVENFATDIPCNWFQTYENHIDEVHIAFVHSYGGSHQALGRELKLPQLSVEETPFGMVRETSSGGGPKRATLYLFPNTMRIIIPPTKGLDGIGGWRDSYVTLVPTDDTSHIMFKSQHVHLDPEQIPQYQEAWDKFQKRVAAYPTPREVARDVLDGKYTLYDVLDHPLLLAIEDCVAQQGQGEIVDRNLERLGRTDIGIVRMRRLFERELGSISRNQPTKQWIYSGEPPNRGF